MITNWDIYWITRLDDLRESIITCSSALEFIIVSLLTVIALFLGYVLATLEFSNREEEELGETFCKAIRKVIKPLIVIYSIILFIGILGTFAKPFIPTTKQMVAIYALPPAINNEEVQQLPENILRFINKQLREWAEETTEEE